MQRLSDGTATFKISDLNVNSYNVTATYIPADEETNYQTSTSSVLTFTVSQKPLTFTVSGTD